MLVRGKLISFAPSLWSAVRSLAKSISVRCIPCSDLSRYKSHHYAVTMASTPEKDVAPVVSRDVEMSQKPSIDADALKLAEMGYTQDMSRNFSVWSVLGVGFSLTNSWFGISAALITGINSGGPILIIYGIILIALISTCVGISLSELASALPNAGGQYFWANELAPKKYANVASYLTGWLAWWGSMFTSASVALAMGSAMVGCYQLSHPDLYVAPSSHQA